LHRRAIKLGYEQKVKNNNKASILPVVSVPPDLLPVAFIKGSVGVRGDIKVVYEKYFKNFYYKRLKKPLFYGLTTIWIHSKFSIFPSRIDSVAQYKEFFRLSLEKINNRETAHSFIGSFLEISKSDLLNKLTYRNNNKDLVNFKIINLNGKTLGFVEKVDGNGFHDWIFSGQLVIPIVDKHIKKIDLVNEQVLVDWEDFW
jgi:ribosomal 30S subunit maturation factor RimM